MPISLQSIMSLANQAANKSEAGASKGLRDASREADIALEKALRKKEADNANIQRGAGGAGPGQAEFEKEASKTIGAPQAAAAIKNRMQPVDPMAQVDLMLLLPQEQQDYARVTFDIIANQAGQGIV